jgi:hypothetical protein
MATQRPFPYATEIHSLSSAEVRIVHSQPGVDPFTVHESVAAETGGTAPPESTPIEVRVSSSAMRADVERLDALI